MTATRAKVLRRTAIGVLAALALVWLAAAGRPYLDGFSLVVRAADLKGGFRALADLNTVTVVDRIVGIPVPGGSLRARVYSPSRTPRQTVLVVAGLHPDGIDEPRFVSLSRTLAEMNVVVVTPEIEELSRYEISGAVTDRIEQAAVWLATESGLAANGRIGLIGISFSGGLALVAAGRPPLEAHLAYVVSIGGHDDLRRVLDYFSPGLDQGRLPHDFGAAVGLLNLADRVVPPNQVALLRDAVRRYLRASYLDVVDKPAAAREFAALRALASTLPEPSATLLAFVNDRDVAELGSRLLPHLGDYVDQPALSPSRSPMPSAPVYLLHGRQDTVIPASESEHLADRLRGHVPVHLLLTDVISHVDADPDARFSDVVQLVRFWGDVLAE